MKMPSVLHDNIKLTGGWDTQSPTLELPPGFVRKAVNFECNVMGGYTRIPGYERFDGRPAPSAANYKLLYTASFTTLPVYGNTLTGQTSGATGFVYDVDVATHRIAITKTTGVFQLGETLKVGANVVGVSVSPTSQPSISIRNQLLGKAADVYRADIQAVGGASCAGKALGYVLYNDVVYAFRANSSGGTPGTSVLLYKSSAGGWVNVPYYDEVYFTNNSGTAPAEGATLTQGGVTATIKRIVLQSGAWGTNAAGKFIITAPAGGNFSAAGATAGATAVTLTGAQTAISFTHNGSNRFEFDYGNFYGSAATYRLYGCDGVNRMFEFDGDVLVPIDTFTPANKSVDTPKHICIHKNRLFCSIGSQLTGSVPGLPYNYQGTAFAWNVGVGENVTNLEVMPGAQTTATMMVTGAENTYMLYGVDYSSFNFVMMNTGAGARDYTARNMQDAYIFDDRGATSLTTTLNYGNFDLNTLTFQISKFIEQNRSLVTASSLNRRKSQYRLWFSNGYALYITVANGKLIGVMPIAFPTPAYMVDNGKYSSGEEASFFCGTDGFLYHLDKGPSFDGAAISAFITLKYHSASSPRTRKRYRKAAVEVSGSSYCQLSLGYNLGYGNSDIHQDNLVAYDANIASPVWDGFTWDNFTWDGQAVSPSECGMTGTGENVAFTIRSSSPYFQEHTINNIIVHYSNRRDMR